MMPPWYHGPLAILFSNATCGLAQPGHQFAAVIWYPRLAEISLVGATLFGGAYVYLHVAMALS